MLLLFISVFLLHFYEALWLTFVVFKYKYIGLA